MLWLEHTALLFTIIEFNCGALNPYNIFFMIILTRQCLLNEKYRFFYFSCFELIQNCVFILALRLNLILRFLSANYANIESFITYGRDIWSSFFETTKTFDLIVLFNLKKSQLRNESNIWLTEISSSVIPIVQLDIAIWLKFIYILMVWAMRNVAQQTTFEFHMLQ